MCAPLPPLPLLLLLLHRHTLRYSTDFSLASVLGADDGDADALNVCVCVLLARGRN